MMIRRCTVAGMFYPADPVQLTGMLDGFFSHIQNHEDAKGIVSPHAGYVYSGQTAADAFSAIRSGFNGTFIIIGPSHRGFSTCLSALPWDTPLGQVQNDEELGSLIDIPVDERSISFGNENSLEVQIPFIKYRFPNAKIVPIMMGHQTFEEIVHVSKAISSALSRYHGDVRIVASSDFSHYVHADKARKDDLYAIEALTQNMDVRDFYTRIQKGRITACGYGPIGSMIEALKPHGITSCNLISYVTSGDVSGDYDQVVGYAALAVK